MKTNLKLIWLSVAITVSGIFVLTWLILNRDIFSILEKPLSAIGNIPTNYLMYLLGSGIVFYFVFLFFVKIYFAENANVKWELYALPVLVLLTLVIPYNDEALIAKTLHTAAGVIGALVIVFIMYKVNKFYFPENDVVKKITHNIPRITIVGTLALFFAFGLNTIMQLFYLFMSLLWINLTAFSKHKNKKEKDKK